jgi:hypothetical protein
MFNITAPKGSIHRQPHLIFERKRAELRSHWLLRVADVGDKKPSRRAVAKLDIESRNHSGWPTPGLHKIRDE